MPQARDVPALSVSLTADDMITVDFGSHEKANAQVRTFWQHLQLNPLPGYLHPVAGMNCLSFFIDQENLGAPDLEAMMQQIKGVATHSLGLAPKKGRTLEIPICYDISMAPDLERLAEHCGISVKEVVRRHSSGKYIAQLIGFLPGFVYLGGLDPKLATPRLASPRAKVTAGSLGIAGAQCAVYPTSSPGGWNLIGRSPLRLFDPKKDVPTTIQLGDEIRFLPISIDEFERQWASR